MDGYHLRAFFTGESIDEKDEGTELGGQGRSGGRNRFAPQRNRWPRFDSPEENRLCSTEASGQWFQRGLQGLLVGACLALMGLILFALFSSSSPSNTTSSVPPWARWEVVCLGVSGGLDQSDLPGGFLLRALPSEAARGTSPPAYVSLDAGTALFGLQRALQSSTAPQAAAQRTPAAGLTAAGTLYRSSVQGYLISHAHLDHTAGLVLGSPDDAFASPRKIVAGTNYTIDALQTHVFNWKVWPNMGDGGSVPIGLYQLATLSLGVEHHLTLPGAEVVAVRPFLLSRGKMGDGSTYFSTAFLLRAGDDHVLYFGDTGADRVEGGNYMEQVWTHVAPLVRTGKLRAIFLECSYADDRSADKLYGHLNPELFMQEMGVLARLVAGQQTVPSSAPGLKGLQVVVTHIKPEDLVYARQESALATIRRQLEAQNTLGLELVFPRQGDWLYF